jgi:hypothetical protein
LVRAADSKSVCWRFKSFPACLEQQQEIAERGNMKVKSLIAVLVAIVIIQFVVIYEQGVKHDEYVKAEARQKAEKEKAEVLALQEREKVRKSKILDLRHKVEEMKCISDTERIQICEQAIELNDVSVLQELYSKFGWVYFGYEDQILTEEQQCLILRAARKANPEIFRFLLERFVNVGWRG